MKFEPVKRFADQDTQLPQRTTKYAAGYDMFAAEDIIIPPYHQQVSDLYTYYYEKKIQDFFTLDELANLTKETKIRPTLVSTGVKVKLDNDKYLKLVSRSSVSNKDWLVLANGEGIIDADYYGNESNDGEIFFQFINFSPVPVKINKGDRIGQGIILPYYLTDDDSADGTRIGGFGSTGSH